MAWVVKRPLSHRDMRRFGIQAALDRGFDALVLDLSDALHPNLDNRRHFVPDPGRVEVRMPVGRRAMMAELRALAGVDLIVPLIVAYDLSSLVLEPMRALSRTDVPLLLMAPQPIPSLSIAEVAGGPLSSSWRRLRHADPLTSLLARMPPKMVGVRQADFIVYGCACAERPSRLVGSETKRIYAHSWDYDLLLDVLAEPVNEKPQAVFLDQYIPFHPDGVALGAKPVDPRRYYADLNRVFARIEHHHGIEVVVAAHPRADYSDKPWAFPGRRIEMGNTTRLIAESRLVIAHYSSALNQAAAAGKVVMLLVSQALLERDALQPGNFLGFARALGTPLVHFDDPDNVDVTECLAPGACDTARFTENFLRHPKAQLTCPLWDIIFHEVL